MAEDSKKVIVKTYREPEVRKRLQEVYDSREWREYNHGYPKRGRAVIVNFYHFHDSKQTRVGSEKDVERLSSVLRDKLKFEVDEWPTEGLDSEKFLEMVEEEAKREDHKDGDCFLMVLMTHGCRGNLLQAYLNPFYLETVVDYFTGEKCRHLLGKPKIFIVQACRGGEKQSGSMVISKGASPYGSIQGVTLPTYADIVIAQSQYEGFASNRHKENGSYFIQSLCEVLERDFEKPKESKDDLLQLLTITAHLVAHYEFLEKRKVTSDGGGDDNEDDDVDLDSGHSKTEEGEVETDAKPFDPRKKPPQPPPKYQVVKLVKQQPTIITTLLRLFYLYRKDPPVDEKAGGDGTKS